MEKKGMKEICAVGSDNLKEMPSLYMCIQVQNFDRSARWMIKSINLSDLITCSSFSNPNPNPKLKPRQVLTTAWYLRLPSHPGCCVSGSKIIFGGGLNFPEDPCDPKPAEPSNEIFEFETDPRLDPNPKLKKSEKPFLKGKFQTMMMTLPDGKLYAIGFPQLDRDPASEEVYLAPFEGFDFPKQTWSLLPPPPFKDLQGCCSYIFELAYSTVETSILLSALGGNCTYRFDAACPSKGWTKHSITPLPCSVGRALVLNHSADNFIMFGYESAYENSKDIRNFTIGVHLMDKNVYFWRHFASLLVLPPEFLLQLPHEFFPVDNYSIVHLGGQIICLVLSKSLLLIQTCALVTFEYCLSPNSKTMDFSILGFRLLEFAPDPLVPTSAGSMLGAFLVGDPVQDGNAFTDCAGKFLKATKGIVLQPGEEIPNFLFERATTSGVATMADMGGIPNHSSLVPVAARQENHFASCSFVPDSVLPCPDFITANGGNSYQYSQQNTGCYPNLAGPGTMYPNTHAMVGHMQGGVPNIVPVGLGYECRDSRADLCYSLVVGESSMQTLRQAGPGYVYPNYQAEEYRRTYY